MSWFARTNGEPAALPVPVRGVAAAELPLALDAQLFKHHFDALMYNAGQEGHVEAWLAALGAKQQACAGLRTRAGGVTLDGIETVLGQVFTARRRLYPALVAVGETRVSGLVRNLFGDDAPVADRIRAFVDAMPGAIDTDRESLRAAAKLRRAAWDFAAELVHFAEPEVYPLMSRWVWDESTQSGALREFIRGNDAMREIPFTNDPGQFEGARCWLGERIAEEGVYRDLPLWIDLVLAQAYASYMRSMAEGSLGADFGRGVSPHEQIRKLLGIDIVPGSGSRVKKS